MRTRIMWWLWLAGVLPAHLAVHALLPRLRQDRRYHLFADRRGCCGVPNAMDVWSNLGFAAVAAAGAAAAPALGDDPLGEVWAAFFAGMAATAAGSAYYHWKPSNERLVWDRLPMTVGFSALFVAAVHDSTEWRRHSDHLRPVLAAFLLMGAASVLYWRALDDLRPYAVVQYYPMLCVLCLAREPPYTSMLWWYAAAKAAEAADRPIFRLTGGRLSGHTLKHLLAAAAAACPLRARLRRPAAGAE